MAGRYVASGSPVTARGDWVEAWRPRVIGILGQPRNRSGRSKVVARFTPEAVVMIKAAYLDYVPRRDAALAAMRPTYVGTRI